MYDIMIAFYDVTLFILNYGLYFKNMNLELLLCSVIIKNNYKFHITAISNLKNKSRPKNLKIQALGQFSGLVSFRYFFL